MRHLIIVLIILTFGCGTKETSNQNAIESDTILVNQNDYDEGETGCTHVKSNKKPASTYPFNRSDKVELVSYPSRLDSYSNNELIQDGKFAVKEIQQRIRLNKTERDSLFSMLYNFKKIRKGNVQSLADCYNPRHSIVFYEGVRAIAFLEICFECSATRQTKGLDFGEFCDEKWCTIQKFFKAQGAGFGLINEMCE